MGTRYNATRIISGLNNLIINGENSRASYYRAGQIDKFGNLNSGIEAGKSWLAAPAARRTYQGL